MGSITINGWSCLTSQEIPITADIVDLLVYADHLVLTPDADNWHVKSLIPPDVDEEWGITIVNADTTFSHSIILPVAAAGITAGFGFFYNNVATQLTLAPSQSQSCVFVPGYGWLFEFPGTLT